MRGDDIRNADRIAERLKLLRLVWQGTEDAVGDCVRSRIADEDRIAVRLLLHVVGGADRSAATGLVFHDGGDAPCLLQVLCEIAADHVGAAAGSCRHDDPDRVGRTPLG